MPAEGPVTLGFVFRANHNPLSDEFGNKSTELSAAAPI